MKVTAKQKDGAANRRRGLSLLAAQAIAIALLAGCEAEPLKPMDEPLGSEDAYRAEERMRQNVDQMMEEADPGQPNSPAESYR